MGHARALLSLREGKSQLELCKRIVRDALTVRDVEREVAKRQEGDVTVEHPEGHGRRASTPGVPEAQIKDLEDQLRKVLGLRVRIRQGATKGRLVIEYRNAHDFERLFVRLAGEKPRG